ncbi:M24 family metallopeptidase [Peribacillus kribbensis]|uniref:M24 family metallopeptidase n=1 Tax=Peribacillus kribbensis TaxID=356658 RepID=UPI00041BF8B1|nr:Xaa-Pro peptidase family protein [Peribacillus kribbensis]
MTYQKRIEKVQHLLDERNIEAAVITAPANFFYFSGTWLDSHERLQAVVIPKLGKPVMIVHEMSKEEIELDGPFDTVFWKDGDPSLKILAKVLPEAGLVSVDNLWPSQNLLALMKLCNQVTFVDSTEVIGKARITKDEQEVDLLEASGQVADTVMKKIINFIKPGMTEKQVADEMKRLFADYGVDDLSFSPIVGAGRNGAIPHHQSDDTMIDDGDMVVIDMGGIKDHYCSDMTRTVLVGGEATKEMQKVYDIVRRAQEEAVKAVRPGVPLKEIDLTARNVITKEGYGDYFTHRTGHGLGIEVHEEPFVTNNNEQILEEGMVISIEPGVYLSGQFGVRIEDIVVVTSTGSKRLNHVTRDLINTVSGAAILV